MHIVLIMKDKQVYVRQNNLLNVIPLIANYTLLMNYQQ